jgi:hypothetical protein
MDGVRYCVLAALLISPPSFAARSVPIELIHIGTDAAGVALAAELRQAIRGFESARTAHTDDTEGREPYSLRLANAMSRPHIRLQLLTTSLSEPAPYTAASVNLTFDSAEMPLGGAFMGGMFETCNADEVAACARRIVVKVNTALSWLRDKWPELWATL